MIQILVTIQIMLLGVFSVSAHAEAANLKANELFQLDSSTKDHLIIRGSFAESLYQSLRAQTELAPQSGGHLVLGELALLSYKQDAESSCFQAQPTSGGALVYECIVEVTRTKQNKTLIKGNVAQVLYSQMTQLEVPRSLQNLDGGIVSNLHGTGFTCMRYINPGILETGEEYECLIDANALK